MSDARIEHVKKTFQRLDRGHQGYLILGDLIGKYNSELHPRVRTREKTVCQVQQEFAQAISAKSQDGFRVTELEFLDYYADVSACLPTEREDHFINVASV
jgi:hypothetical protein